MATAMSSTNVLSLKDHCERLLQRYTEPLLEDSHSAHGRRAQEAVESGLDGHLWLALETWRQPRRGGTA